MPFRPHSAVFFRSLTLASILCFASLEAAENGLLLHWSFDGASVEGAEDRSGNSLSGTGKAERVEAGKGKAAFLDGTSATAFKVVLPDDKRFGKESFTLMAWVKPFQFKYEDRQNQRRLFAYGRYPEAYVTFDLNGNGTLGNYDCYKNADGKVVSAGGGGSRALSTNRWAHVALVIDRGARAVRTYVNGTLDGEQDFPKGFDPDYSLSGELTVGNGWHNYWGAVDEVKVYRRALSAAELAAQVAALAGEYGLEKKDLAGSGGEGVNEAFAAAGEAFVAGKFAEGRSALQALLGKAELSPAHRALAQIRVAQAWAFEGKLGEAKSEYQKIAQNNEYPEIHRQEARELVGELERKMKGLSPRDPEATRTKVAPLPTPGVEIFLSPNGSDKNSGSREKPLATLEAARDLLRQKYQGKTPAGGACVTLSPGTYVRRDVFLLESQDGGSAGAPVCYRSERPGAATLYGGTRLGGFKPLSDNALLARLPTEARGKVWQCDLKKLGITDTGRLVPRGMGAGTTGNTTLQSVELFWNGLPLTLARWPNKGFATIADIPAEGRVTISGFPGTKIPQFIYEGDRPSRWSGEKEIWLLGYWFWDWAEAQYRVGALDTAAKTFKLDVPKDGYGWRKGQRYFAYNLFSEIDEPGEWYLDRDASMLYLWPPSSPEGATAELGMLATNMVRLEGASHLRLEGLSLDLGRENAVMALGATNVQLVGLRIARFGGMGIHVTGSRGVTIHSCDVGMLGRHGVVLFGGDRATLTPADYLLENTQVYSNSRIDPTYAPMVLANGVGIALKHNLFHHCPSSAGRFEGNELRIEYNEMHSVVLESDDQGAMESWGNPTFRGILLRHNYFHDIGGSATLAGQAAIRYDDAISGIDAQGNLIERAAAGHFGGIQINSGRDNLMDGNIFYDCQAGISGGFHPGNQHWQKVRDGKGGPQIITNALFLERYPLIKGMLDDQGRNFSWRNLFVKSGKAITGNKRSMEQLLAGVYTNADPGFQPGTKQLRDDADACLRWGIRPIPVDEIGLYLNAWRVATVKPPVTVIPDWRGGASREAAAKPHPMAPIAVKRFAKAPVLGETADWPAPALKLAETPTRGNLAGPAASAFVARHGDTLYITVAVPVESYKIGNNWGNHDGMELCFREAREIADGIRRPTLILQGFADGSFQSAGNPDEEGFDKELRRLKDGSQMKMKKDEKSWTASWAIPLSALGLTPGAPARLQFNIGVRRTKPDDWIALAGCMGANFLVQNGAVLVLE